MESWLIWNMLGLYPVVGQTTFLIGSPWFANTTIALGSDKALSVSTVGGSHTSFYVQSLRVNGQEWTKSWLTWDDVFANGGTMEFFLGPESTNWMTGSSPPSPASELGRADVPKSIPTRPLERPEQAEAKKPNPNSKKWRYIGLGLMGVAIFLLVIFNVAFWWFKRKRRSAKTNPPLEKEEGPDTSALRVEGEFWKNKILIVVVNRVRTFSP